MDVRRAIIMLSMFRRPWDEFFKTRISRMLEEKKRLLDIGGGLRLATDKSNRNDPRNRWIVERIRERGVDYRVLDYVDTFHPDIVGDIQDLPLTDSSEEAIACIAVLEHVENPIKAASELYRVLAPGGYCLVYVPFLYYYHAHDGYYRDYWRFTKDSLESLFAPFSVIEMQNVRGPLETLVRLSPLGRTDFFQDIAYLFDKAFGKLSSKQTSGYYVFLRK